MGLAPAPFEDLGIAQSGEPMTARDVYVVDDDADVRRSLHFALATVGITAWPFAAPEDFVDQLDALQPAPILLDLRMPTLDGMQVLQILHERKIRWPVIMLSAHGDIPIAVRAMRLGAIDFVEKPFGLDALETILARGFAALPAVVTRTRVAKDASAQLGRLTAREKDIVRMLVKGLSNKVIAYNLGLSDRTVENHRSNALKKLRTKSLAQVQNLMNLASGDQVQ